MSDARTSRQVTSRRHKRDVRDGVMNASLACHERPSLRFLFNSKQHFSKHFSDSKIIFRISY